MSVIRGVVRITRGTTVAPCLLGTGLWGNVSPIMQHSTSWTGTSWSTFSSAWGILFLVFSQGAHSKCLYPWCGQGATKKTMNICDVSSEKVPEPPYVNIEKIAKTWPKVNFAEFLFISLNDYLPTEEWFLRVWRKIFNVLVVFELIASLKVTIRHVFLNVWTALHHLLRNIHCFPQNRFESDSWTSSFVIRNLNTSIKSCIECSL